MDSLCSQANGETRLVGRPHRLSPPDRRLNAIIFWPAGIGPEEAYIVAAPSPEVPYI